MGYETTLIIGKIYPEMILESDNGKLMVSDIATIDLSGSDFIGTQIDESDTIEAFIYSNSRTVEEKITQDCYGKPLYAIDPKKVLDFMKAHNKGEETYRRYDAAIPMLESLINSFDPEIEPLKCVLYGH